MNKIAIVDYGMGNLRSVQNALNEFGAKGDIVASPDRLADYRKIILPGVGAFGEAAARLESSGLASELSACAARRNLLLGICLGMQLLFRRSEEGPTDCLGILPEGVRRLRAEPGRPVPHMGWNQLCALHEDPLLEGIAPRDYVYFVHSYAVPVSSNTLATAHYGEPLSAIVRRRNFWGTQFHPERSAATGARLLANFLRLG